MHAWIGTCGEKNLSSSSLYPLVFILYIIVDIMQMNVDEQLQIFGQVCFNTWMSNEGFDEERWQEFFEVFTFHP